MPFVEKAVLPDDLIQKFMQELSVTVVTSELSLEWLFCETACTISQEKCHHFFPPVHMLSNPGCSVFPENFIWNKLFTYFEKLSPNLQVFRLMPDKDTGANKLIQK